MQTLIVDNWSLDVDGDTTHVCALDGNPDERVEISSMREGAFVVAYVETGRRNGTDYATATIVARLFGLDLDVLDAGERGVIEANMNDAHYDVDLDEALREAKEALG